MKKINYKKAKLNIIELSDFDIITESRTCPSGVECKADFENGNNLQETCTADYCTNNELY